MNKIILTLQRSVIILFSFAMVAAMLTIINVGVNESGNPLSSITAAHADNSLNLVAGQTGAAIPTPSSGGPGCIGSLCGGSGYGGQGGSSSSAPIFDPNLKSVYYNCGSVDGAGNCTANTVVTTDRRTYWVELVCAFTDSGIVVASDGNSAVSYLENNYLGQDPNFPGWWVPGHTPENMFSWLTGYDNGWAPYPIAWSQLLSFGYNGTTSSFSSGQFSWGCHQVLHTVPAYNTKNVVCSPMNDGRPFPYAVGYYVTYRNINPWPVVWSGGTVKQFDWQIVNETCVYVSPSTPPPTVAAQNVPCYWNMGYSGNYSTNRSAILAGGTPTSRPPVALDAPAGAPFLTGANSTSRLNNCTSSMSMNASLSLADGYAYYRLSGSASLQRYQYYYWDPSYVGGQWLLANIVAQGVQGFSKSVYGTFTCQNNPPFKQYGDWGSLPNITFSYADCGRGPEWQCLDPNNPRINNVDNPVELMRDGTNIPTNLGAAQVSGAGIRDSVSGQVGTVSDSNMSFMVNLVNGSSPLYGSDPNDSKQYFKLWNPSRSATIPFGQWVSSPNANQHSILNFFWSSDTGSNWKMTYQAKINTAQFAVPWQDTSTSAPTTKWMTDTNISCGSGTSNPATILRSVTSK